MSAAKDPQGVLRVPAAGRAWRGAFGRAWASALALLGLAAQAADPVALPLAPAHRPAPLQLELLQSAKRWLADGRADLARQVLAKLLVVNPHSPEALAFLMDLALREHKTEDAQALLQRLQRSQAQHPLTRDMAMQLRAATDGREALAQLRLLARAGRAADALGVALQLFPEGLPQHGAMGAEMARLSRAAQADRLAQRARSTFAPMRRSSAAQQANSATGSAAAPAHERAAQARAQAKLLAQTGHTEQAMQLLQEALQESPQDAWLRHDAAGLYLRQNTPQQAQHVMDEGVALQPQDADMRYARALVLSALDAHAAALADLAAVPEPQRTPGMQALAQRLQVDGHVAQAAQWAAAAPAQAQAHLDEAEQWAGDHLDLLRTVSQAWGRAGQWGRSAALWQRRLQREARPLAPAPDSAPGATGPEGRATHMEPEMAPAHAPAHEPAHASEVGLTQAFETSPTADPAPLASAQTGAQLHAALLWELVHALARAEDDEGLNAAWPAVWAHRGWRAPQSQELRELRVAQLERLVAQALQAGLADRALHWAHTPLPFADAPADALDAAHMARARGRLLGAAGAHAAAAAALQQALQLWPAHEQPQEALDVHMAWAEALDKQGPSPERLRIAQQAVPEWLRLAAHAEVWRQLALLRLLQRVQAHTEAQRLSQDLLAAHPTDVQVLLHAARLARSQRQDAQALALWQEARKQAQAQAQAQAQVQDAVPNAALDSPMRADAQATAQAKAQAQARQALELTLSAMDADIQTLQERRASWLEWGHLRVDKSGSAGTSALRRSEQALVAWRPGEQGGHWFARLDAVRLDAGLYSPEPGAAGGLLGQAANLAAPVPSSAQGAQGAHVGLGFQGDGMRWDVGLVGAGFAVRNVVGGLRQSWDVGAVAVSAEASRRVLTGSLLSYAGAIDPQTGQVWGGVVATGVGLRLSREVGAWQLQASAHTAQLGGRRVADNQRHEWRLAASQDLRWPSAPQQVLNVGLSLSGLHHAKDLSGYTWGQGGYYSPGRNHTWTVPLVWSGHAGPWAWGVRASRSWSRTHTLANARYPTDALAQQQWGDVRAAGRSAGSGWSLSVAADRVLSAQWVLGTQVLREHSPYYTPLTVQVHVRKWLGNARAVQALQPRLVQPYAQF